MGRQKKVADSAIIKLLEQWPKGGKFPSTGDVTDEVNDQFPDAEYNRKTVYRRLDALASKGRIEKIEVGTGRGRTVGWYEPHAYTLSDIAAQLEVSKEFLEASHGRALKYGTPKEARAYYEAINLVDDALERAWDLEKAARDDSDHHRELVAESRAAREKGVKAATKHDERRQQMREKYTEPPSIIDWAMSRIPVWGDD